METIYYDLIQLPSGGHVPVPIANKLVGCDHVDRIPIARKKRDNAFFTCPICGDQSFFKNDCHAVFISVDEDFYNKVKEIAFMSIISKRNYHKLRYIKALEPPCLIPSESYSYDHSYGVGEELEPDLEDIRDRDDLD